MQDLADSWQAGINAFEGDDHATAIEMFQGGQQSKMLYNLGVVYMKINCFPEAIVGFESAIMLDNFFAVAYYQRAWCYFKLGDFSKARIDLEATERLLRENNCIDYGKIGLADVFIYKGDILYNAVLTELHNNNPKAAQSVLDRSKAIETRDYPKKAILDALAVSIQSKAYTQLFPLNAGFGLFPAPSMVSPRVREPQIVDGITKLMPRLVERRVSAPKIPEPQVQIFLRKVLELPLEDRQRVNHVLLLLKQCKSTIEQSHASDVAGKEELAFQQVLSMSRLMFDQNNSDMLRNHSALLMKSSQNRAEKWRHWCSLLDDEEQLTSFNDDGNFVKAILKSDALSATVHTACVEPVLTSERAFLLSILASCLLGTISPRDVVQVILDFSSLSSHLSRLVPSAVDMIASLKRDPHLKTPSDDDSHITTKTIDLLHSANIARKLGSSHSRIEPLIQEITGSEKDQQESLALLEQQQNENFENREFVLGTQKCDIEQVEREIQAKQKEILDIEAMIQQKKLQQKNTTMKIGELEALVEAGGIDEAKQQEQLQSQIKSSIRKTAKCMRSVAALRKFSEYNRDVLHEKIDSSLSQMVRVLEEQEKRASYLEEKLANYAESKTMFSGDAHIMAGLKAAFEKYQVLFHSCQTSMRHAESSYNHLAEAIFDDSYDFSALRATLKGHKQEMDRILQRLQALDSKYSLN